MDSNSSMPSAERGLSAPPKDELDNFINLQYGAVASAPTSLGVVNPLVAVFEEIAEWKLEAKLEDNERYFFHVREVNQIEEGKRSYVIGRKGCGKTAIAQYLCRHTEHDRFSVKLTFKNFPFNELYELKDLGYAAPHQYITLWKFLIYSHVCQLMAQNQAIPSEVRDRLHATYIDNQAPTLPRRINKWLDREFAVDIFGVGANIGASPEADQRRISLIERVNKLEDLLLEHVDSSRYLIVFDELDEDYRNIIERQQYDQYSALVTGLFKAVQDVRSIFADKRFRIYPIVFLRDDIYDVIQDSDRTKWNDLKITLDWDADRILELIAFRISRAVGASAPTLSFEQAWHLLFFPAGVGFGTRGRKSIHSFDYIARSTHMRPRDFIQYLKACCEEELRRSDRLTKITPDVIKKVDTAFSNYLKSELIDEIHGVLPDISSIFDILSQLRKWSFNSQEFIDAYNRQLKRVGLRERDAAFVLQVLFLFSVIGHHPQGNQHKFHYLNKEARLNFDDQVIIHRGLFKALQV